MDVSIKKDIQTKPVVWLMNLSADFHSSFPFSTGNRVISCRRLMSISVSHRAWSSNLQKATAVLKADEIFVMNLVPKTKAQVLFGCDLFVWCIPSALTHLLLNFFLLIYQTKKRRLKNGINFSFFFLFSSHLSRPIRRLSHFINQPPFPSCFSARCNCAFLRW